MKDWWVIDNDNMDIVNDSFSVARAVAEAAGANAFPQAEAGAAGTKSFQEVIFGCDDVGDAVSRVVLFNFTAFVGNW